MQAVANNPKFAKKVGVPTKVGKEFTKETKVKKKVKKYEGGGMAEEGYSRLADMQRQKMRAEMGRPKTPGDLARIQAERDAIGMIQQKAHEMRMRANLDSAIKGEEAKAAAQARAAQAKPPMPEKMPRGMAVQQGFMGAAPNLGRPLPPQERSPYAPGMKKGGAVKSKSKSKSKTNCRRGDGICKQGKTKGRMI